jgi:hypothetical protein
MKIFRVKEPSALSGGNFQNKRTAGSRVFAEKSDSKEPSVPGIPNTSKNHGAS